ncbi:hypothetical protein Tco_0713782 [Tanacetum coccineum]
MVIHTMDGIDIVTLVVEIESFGMSFDEFDKETGSPDRFQPKQAELINISSVQILNQFDICHKFAPLSRKSIQKLGVQLKLFQFQIVDVHVH